MKKDNSFLWIAITTEEMAWIGSSKKDAIDMAIANDSSVITLLLKIDRSLLPPPATYKTIEVK